MNPEDFDIDEPMGPIGGPHDRFDQCDAKENGVGERCSFEMGHDGDKHSFDYDTRRDIHDYFGLSYANYLVVNRSLLQSMPEKWQKDFVEMLDEFSREFGWAMELQPAINVQILAREPERIDREEECEECEGSGQDPDNPEEECSWCIGGMVSVEGDYFETPGEVGVIQDPVPHYERGRSRIPRASQSIDDVGDNRSWRMYGEWMKANHHDEWEDRYGNSV